MTGALVYTASGLWLGAAGSRIDDGAVVVVKDRIEWAGAEAQLPETYAGAEKVHFDGCTLMPGLIESHAHLSYDGAVGTKARSFARSAPALVGVMLASARELLSVGVTTTRDLGARDNLSIEARDLIEEGVAEGPRLLVAGAQITTTGGHTWQNHARADTPAQLRTLVRTHHRAGVDLFKINVTGGFLTPGSGVARAQYSRDEISIVVDEAHRLGKKVAAHAHGVEGIAHAVQAGVDTIEHATFVHGDGSFGPVDGIIDEMVSQGTFVCATTPWNLPKMTRANASFRSAVPSMHERGVKIIAGNDAGVDGVPHRNYVGGLESLVLLGLPDEEVLVAATSRAADALGLSGKVGVIAPGASADLIAVGGDPATDVSRIRDLRAVIVRGRRFVPDPVEPDAEDPDYVAARRTKEAR